MNEQPLKEGIDFYLEKSGLMVFTTAYHLKRGSCCGKGCRNCPYDYAGVRDEAKRKVLKQRRREVPPDEKEEIP